MTRLPLARTVLFALVAAQACTYVPPDKRGRRSAAVTSSDKRGFGSKRVIDKKVPTRLIASDGTSCVVSESKFESTNLGSSVLCLWFDAEGEGVRANR